MQLFDSSLRLVYGLFYRKLSWILEAMVLTQLDWSNLSYTYTTPILILSLSSDAQLCSSLIPRPRPLGSHCLLDKGHFVCVYSHPLLVIKKLSLSTTVSKSVFQAHPTIINHFFRTSLWIRHHGQLQVCECAGYCSSPQWLGTHSSDKTQAMSSYGGPINSGGPMNIHPRPATTRPAIIRSRGCYRVEKD